MNSDSPAPFSSYLRSYGALVSVWRSFLALASVTISLRYSVADGEEFECRS